MSSCTVSSSLSCLLLVVGTWKGLPWSSLAHPAYPAEQPDLWPVSTLAVHEVLCCPCQNSRSWLLAVACPCPSVAHDRSFVVAYMFSSSAIWRLHYRNAELVSRPALLATQVYHQRRVMQMTSPIIQPAGCGLRMLCL